MAAEQNKAAVLEDQLRPEFDSILENPALSSSQLREAFDRAARWS